MSPSGPTIAIVGDGPTGLSCALLLAKNGVTCHVVGSDQTPTHKALFHNLLGSPDTPGPELMATARRQVEAVGAQITDGEVTEITRQGTRFRLTITGADTLDADIVVLANGRDLRLARSLGVATTEDKVRADRDGKTDVAHVYAGGWLTRGAKIQAAISIGDGAAIALDILSELKGKAFHDFDVLERPATEAGPQVR